LIEFIKLNYRKSVQYHLKFSVGVY
jgi:hypothetical protein